MTNYFMSTLYQIMPTILRDETVQECCENLLGEPKLFGNNIDDLEKAIIQIMNEYYSCRFKNPKIFTDQHFKRRKHLYTGKNDALYFDFHKEVYAELLRNVLFYILCSNRKFQRKNDPPVKRKTLKSLLTKQLHVCRKLIAEIKTDKSEKEMFAMILSGISSNQIESLNFSDRIYELSRALSYDQTFKSVKFKDYVNFSSIPTENLLIQFLDYYFEAMMDTLDFEKEPCSRATVH